MPLKNQKPTILSVDDCIFMQELIQDALGEKYNILVANNSAEALSLIYQEPISMLLLDVCMPGVNGLDLCRTLRSLPQFAELPIIMVTAKVTVFDKVQGRLAGATAYLTKPFELTTLEKVCHKFIKPLV